MDFFESFCSCLKGVKAARIPGLGVFRFVAPAAVWKRFFFLSGFS